MRSSPVADAVEEENLAIRSIEFASGSNVIDALNHNQSPKSVAKKEYIYIFRIYLFPWQRLILFALFLRRFVFVFFLVLFYL